MVSSCVSWSSVFFLEPTGEEGAEGAPKGDTITQPRFRVVMRMVVEVIQCTARRSLIEGVEVDEDVGAEKG